MHKIILHIDFDSFFASVEQQYNPKLRGRPIGVTAQNGRTCIIAASREAKALGIKSPSRTFEARQTIPDMIFVPAHVSLYWQITQKFIKICKDYSPYVELFSLDEVFIDATPTLHLFNGTYGMVERIKKRIRNEIGEFVTVSVGISHNKLLSKLASGINKPDGIFEITPANIDKVYKNCKLTDFCGIGERVRLRLGKIGIYSPLDLKNAPLELLINEFKDVEGHFLKSIGLGIDDSDVVPYYEEVKTKSVGRNYCLPHNEYDKRIVLQNFYELSEEVALKLRRLEKHARTLGFYLSGDLPIHKRKTYSDTFNEGSEIFKRALNLMKEDFAKTHYTRQIGVWVSNLLDENSLQLSLFENSRRERVVKTIDKINERFGDHTIRNGFLLYADKLTTVPNGFLADKYERTKLSLTSF